MAEKVRVDEIDPETLEERIICIDRVKKTVKGGQLISFRVCVAVGNKDGVVGFGIGKARNTPDAIRKAIERAKKNLIRVPRNKTTLPHEVTGKVGGGIVFLKPASPGTGVIAGGSVRPLLELAGIEDVLSKSLGSNNPMNTASATYQALCQVRDPRHVAELRGKTLQELFS